MTLVFISEVYPNITAILLGLETEFNVSASQITQLIIGNNTISFRIVDITESQGLQVQHKLELITPNSTLSLGNIHITSAIASPFVPNSAEVQQSTQNGSVNLAWIVAPITAIILLGMIFLVFLECDSHVGVLAPQQPRDMA